MKPVAGLAALAATVVVAGGCAATFTQQPGGGFGPPQVVVATPGGGYPLYTPPGMADPSQGLAAPPGWYANNPASLPLPGDGWQDGSYDGTATLLANDFGDCAFRFSMTNLHVNAGRVRFAGFRGRVGADGGVRMADGSLNWITGRLTGGHFGGTYSNRSCTYSLSLDRVGP